MLEALVLLVSVAVLLTIAALASYATVQLFRGRR